METEEEHEKRMEVPNVADSKIASMKRDACDAISLVLINGDIFYFHVDHEWRELLVELRKMRK